MTEYCDGPGQQEKSGKCRGREKSITRKSC